MEGNHRVWVSVMALFSAVPAAAAQSADEAREAIPAPDEPGSPRQISAEAHPLSSEQQISCARCVPALTPVDLIFDDALSSKESKAGDFFRFHLGSPIMAGGTILVPIGTPGVGEVVFAKRSGFSGAAGELVLAARYLEFDGRRIRLRSMAFGKLGVDRVRATGKLIVAAAATGTVAGVATYFIYGSENVVRPGEAAVAKTAEMFELADSAETGSEAITTGVVVTAETDDSVSGSSSKGE